MDTPHTGEVPLEQGADHASYSLWQLVRYFLRLGTLGFGGPVALVGYMQRDLVEQRAWIAEADYQEGLALAQLCPGPLAAQLAMYLGYVRSRILGATLVGLAFIWPSFLMVVALGWLYTRYGGLPWMQAVFYGVGASVIGIIAHSAYKLTTKTIGRDWLLWGIYLVTAAVTILTQTEQVLLFIAAGVLVWLVKAPPRAFWKSWGKGKTRVTSLSPVPLAAVFAAGAAAGGTLWTIFTFFVFAGAFVFGSGLAHRSPVRGRRGCCHDYARPGGDYLRLHRVPGGRPGRGLCGGPGNVSALLCLCGRCRPSLPQVRQTPGDRSFHEGGDGCRHRRYHWGGRRAGTAHDHRHPHGPAGPGDAGPALALEGDSGAVHHRRRRGRRLGRLLSAPSLGGIPRGTAAGNIVGTARL
jgi:chromate transport protein ChrA